MAASRPGRTLIVAGKGSTGGQREGLGRLIAAVSVASSRRAKVVVAAAVLATALLGAGIARLTFSSDFLEALPQDEPNAVAARNVSSGFEGFFNNFQVVFPIAEEKWEEANRKLPDRATEPARGNVTDEVYVRGMEEFHRFFVSRLTLAEAFYDLSFPYAVKAINWSNSGVPGAKPPDDAAFSMPGTDPLGERQYLVAWETVLATSYNDIAILASPGWDAAQGVYPLLPKPGVSEDALGRQLLETFDAYKAWVVREGEWDVFDLDGVSILLSNPAITAHSNELTLEDLLLLGPIVAVFIVGVLWLAFRDLRAIAISGAALVMSVAWTLGIMGWSGIAVNALNLTILPLIMGVGIDYAIHVVNEYLEHRSAGMSEEATLRAAGERSGVGLFIATFTTIAGLSIMALSPSVLMAELGVVSALSMAIVFLLAITFIPAALTLASPGRAAREYIPSRVVPRIGAWVTRNRGTMGAAAVVATLGFLYLGASVGYEVFGNPVKNFPEGDPLRVSYETAATRAFGAGRSDFVSNFFVVQGDLTDPALHAYVRNLTEELRRNDRVRPESVQSLVGVLQTYLTTKDGTVGAPVYLARSGLAPSLPGPAGDAADPYPGTREEIRAALDDMYRSPALAPYVALFVNPTYDISIVTVDVKEGTTFGETSATWDSVWATAARPGEPPGGAKLNFYGYTAFNYLFITHEMPWVAYMGIASSVVVMALVVLLMRDWRSIVAVGVIVVLTTVWWIGVLPLFGIGLAITLMLPMAFITSIGSDYAVHLAWSVKKVGSAWRVLANVGKAVMFSAVTTFGAFALFIPMRDLMMRRAMIATTLALVMILVTTLVVFPLVHRVVPEKAERAPEAAASGIEVMN